VNSDERSAGTLIRPLLLAVAAGWLVFAAINGAAGSRWRTVTFEIAAAAVTLVIRELVRVRPSLWRPAVHVVAGLNTVVLVILAWLGGGGVQGLACWYLPAIPLFATHLDGRRAGWIWCGIAAAASLVATTVDPGIAPEFIPADGQRIVAGIWLVIICTSFAALSRREVDVRMAELERSARARAELTAAISHDIRTPLSGILGVATVLGETELGAEQRQLLSTLRSSGNTLRRIVDDVLDSAQLESGRFRITTGPVDLLALLGEVVDLHAPEASMKGLTIELVARGGAAFRVIADDVRVRQIVSNLVGNAVKFTREGTVTIRASGRREGSRSMIELRVEDTGPGIPADQADRLFERFERLDTDSSRRAGGTGLGLAISRDLVRLMGGTIECERERPRGAGFIVRVSFDAQELREGEPSPAEDAESVRVIGPRAARGEPVVVAPAAPTPVQPATAPRGRALVIDDEATNRRILMEILRHRGFAVVGQPSAIAALERLAAERFDVIFCDLQMPGMDGLAMITRVRAEKHPGHYVATTASVRADDPTRCRDAGFDAFIRKPFRVAELDAIVASLAPDPAQAALIDGAAWAAGRDLMGDEHPGLVAEHLEVARGHVRSIRDGAEDPAAVERAAHTLSSGWRLPGLIALGTAARTLEAQAHTSTPAERRSAGARLESILDATVEAVKALRTDRALRTGRGA